MVANLAALEALDKAIHEHDSSTSESVTGSVDSVQRMPDLLVESTNNKGQQQLQQGQQGQFLAFSEEQNNNKMNSVIQSKVYASVAEMKRMKVNILFFTVGSVLLCIYVLFITYFDEKINKWKSFTYEHIPTFYK